MKIPYCCDQRHDRTPRPRRAWLTISRLGSRRRRTRRGLLYYIAQLSRKQYSSWPMDSCCSCLNDTRLSKKGWKFPAFNYRRHCFYESSPESLSCSDGSSFRFLFGFSQSRKLARRNDLKDPLSTSQYTKPFLFGLGRLRSLYAGRTSFLSVPRALRIEPSFFLYWN